MIELPDSTLIIRRQQTRLMKNCKIMMEGIRRLISSICFSITLRLDCTLLQSLLHG